MKWYIRKTHHIETAEDVYEYMHDNIKYSDFTILKPPEKTRAEGRGSCHDQVLLEMQYMDRLGYKYTTIFFMELDDNGQGGMTHSLLVYEDTGKYYWLENSADMWSGIHSFDSIQQIKDYIVKEHELKHWGDVSKYPDVEFGKFQGEPGDSLQDVVDKSLV